MEGMEILNNEGVRKVLPWWAVDQITGDGLWFLVGLLFSIQLLICIFAPLKKERITPLLAYSLPILGVSVGAGIFALVSSDEDYYSVTSIPRIFFYAVLISAISPITTAVASSVKILYYQYWEHQGFPIPNEVPTRGTLYRGFDLEGDVYYRLGPVRIRKNRNGPAVSEDEEPTMEENEHQ